MSTLASVVAQVLPAASGPQPVIEWMNFITVAVVTMIGAGFVVTMYSLGVRLSAVSDDPETRAPGAAKFGSVVCFGFSILAVLVGIVLIVPPFYKFAMHLLGA